VDGIQVGDLVGRAGERQAVRAVRQIRANEQVNKG
jgi:hypothetical protein